LVPRSQQARGLTDQRRILTERSHPTGRRIGSRAPCWPRTDRLDQANSPQLDLRLDIAGVGLPRRDARKWSRRQRGSPGTLCRRCRWRRRGDRCCDGRRRAQRRGRRQRPGRRPVSRSAAAGRARNEAESEQPEPPSAELSTLVDHKSSVQPNRW